MTKANRWGLIASLVALTAAGLVLFFLLSIATGNRAAYETYYVWLFWVNVVVAGLLLVVIVVALVRLQQRVRGGIFGSRLLLRLVAIFAFVGIVPGVLIYTVSYQFVARSIESWFDVKVEGALDAGLALGRDTLEVQVKDIATKTLLAAERLGDERGEIQPIALERVREQMAAREVAIVGAQGNVIVAAGSTTLTPERPSPALLRQAPERTSAVSGKSVSLVGRPSIT
ncbi:MAG TPA: PAS domain-containing sensor histidine kinase, partial [Burkholderiaceae bacterium]|nr:PAS domain-containing sensor histidine kinase [Burkholderiaceae bacterium]